MIQAGMQYQSTIDGRRGEVHPSAVGSQDKRIALEPLVSIVDDDESVRESLPDLITEFGFAARAFSSPKEFLSSSCVDETRCLIVDVSMPGMTGPELHEELKRRGQPIPIIFITGRKDDIVRARVIKQGASSFLLKPFSDSDLLEAIKGALQNT
jgi:FixJ family two-component response regulator